MRVHDGPITTIMRVTNEAKQYGEVKDIAERIIDGKHYLIVCSEDAFYPDEYWEPLDEEEYVVFELPDGTLQYWKL